MISLLAWVAKGSGFTAFFAEHGGQIVVDGLATSMCVLLACAVWLDPGRRRR